MAMKSMNPNFKKIADALGKDKTAKMNDKEGKKKHKLFGRK